MKSLLVAISLITSITSNVNAQEYIDMRGFDQMQYNVKTTVEAQTSKQNTALTKTTSADRRKAWCEPRLDSADYVASGLNRYMTMINDFVSNTGEYRDQNGEVMTMRYEQQEIAKRQYNKAFNSYETFKKRCASNSATMNRTKSAYEDAVKGVAQLSQAWDRI